MNTNANKMYGVINGLYTCNNERVDELNDRMSARNVPSTGLKPQFSMRPTATKYGYMPILDQYKKATVPLNSYTPYSTGGVFNPGNATAPWNGFSNNVKGIFGPPSFKKWIFDLAGDRRLICKPKYM